VAGVAGLPCLNIHYINSAVTNPPSQSLVEVQRDALHLTAVAAACYNGECPTVYLTNRGTVVVQGYAVQPGDAGLDIPTGELLVEIPSSLLATAARQVTASG